MSRAERRSGNILLVMAVAFALAICFICVENVYAEGPVASNTTSGVTYDTLEEACTQAASGDTIVLIGDETTEAPFKIEGEKKFTIDLNGHTYSNTAPKTAAITIGGAADVTFKDSSDGTGKLIGIDNPLRVDSTSAKLTIESGTYISEGKNNGSYNAVIFNQGTTTIKDGTFLNQGRFPAVDNCDTGIPDYPVGQLKITGGSFTSESGYAISNYGNADINGGEKGVTITTNAVKDPNDSGSYTALCCSRGIVTVGGNTTVTATNPSVNALGAYNAWVYINGGQFTGPVIIGDTAHVVVKNGAFTGDFEMTEETHLEIENGQFQGAIRAFGWNDIDHPTINIKGGEFKGNIEGSTYVQVTIEGGKFSGESISRGYCTTINVSGGYFKHDNVKDYIVEGSKFTDNIDEQQLLADGYRYTVKPDSYCVVKYDTKGGTEIAAVGVTKGDSLPVPVANPEKDGRTFDGWYYDSELTKPVQDSDEVTEDVTLHAAWNGRLFIGIKDFSNGGILQLTVDGKDRGAITEFDEDVREGTAIKVEAKPNPGYRLEKWVDGDSMETITSNAVCEFTYGDTDGYLAYFKPILVEKIRFRTLKSTVAEGEKLQLELTILPSNALNQKVTWHSSDGNVLKVNDSGRVTGISEGAAFITARAKDSGGVSVSRKITVTHTHDLNLVEATEPTCTENGYKEHWKCSKCDKWFSDSNGQYEVAEDSDAVLLPAVGHQWGDGWSTVDEPTTEKDGLEKRTCKRDESHTETRAIPKLNHTHDLSEVSKEEATCTESGHERYYECSGCAAIYLDEEGAQQTSKGDIRIPASGHVKGEPEKGEPTPATCDSVGGYNLITKCKNCGSVLKVERVITPIDPNAHDWDEWITNEDGLEERVCLNDTSHMETRISNAKIVLSAADFTYNGRVQKPSVKTIGKKTLTAGTDYTVSDVSSKNVGAYTVTITGKGDYTGVAKATYRINPKGTSIKKPRKAKKAITVKWKRQKSKMSTSRITGYQIQLATNSNFTQNVKTVNVKGYKKTSRKVKKLMGKTKYYVKVRTYMTVGGTTCYSGWSKIKSVKTK